MHRTFQSYIGASVLGSLLAVNSATPIHSEVIFSSQPDVNGQQETISFDPPPGWARRTDSKNPAAYRLETSAGKCSIDLYRTRRGTMSRDEALSRYWSLIAQPGVQVIEEEPNTSGEAANDRSTWIIRGGRHREFHFVVYVGESDAYRVAAIYACNNTQLHRKVRETALVAILDVSFNRVAPSNNSATSPASCRFRGDRLKALSWCRSQCVQPSLPDRSGLFSPVDSYSICVNDVANCALKNSQC